MPQLIRYHLPLLLLLLPIIFFSSSSLIPHVSSAEIPLNSTLFASDLNQTWSSDNGTFSLGFIPASSSSFTPAITYSGGSVAIWSTRTSVDRSGTLRLLSTGNLVLADGNGSTVWSSNTSSKGVTSASLDDTGNLVLRNASSTVWSSFDNPTDTIVPNQSFAVGQVLTNGYYSFTLLSSGNLTLTWSENGSVVYWNEGLNSSTEANLTSPSLRLQSTGILSISDPSLSSDAVLYYSSDYAEGSDVLRFLRLDSDGNLKIYSSARGSGTSTMRWAAVLDQCRVFGYCGNLGICSYNDSNPVCGCPSRNFEFMDPADSRKGCKRTVEIADCPGSTTMLELDHALFLTYPPELSSEVFFVGISACRLNCLVSGSCIASTSLSDGTGLCYLKTPEYVSGYQNPALPSTSYVKVCGPIVPNPSPLAGLGLGGNGGRLHAWLIAVVVVGTLLGLILVESGLWIWCFRNSPRFGGFSSQYALLEYASGAPVQFTYKELQRSTKGFKEKLGSGGFGAVYRGVLTNRAQVAVKQLEGIEQGERQFRMEVATISSTHHLNLVRLIGFCSEGRHRLLVYEFMKNGSLDNFLFGGGEDVSGKFLSWETRFNIALGTARGITYLHEECRDCIVHCDIKPENILLDDNFQAKVSDFGLAKLINPKDHRYRTLKSVRGTRGYLAPEWLANLLITSKSDVYSYGMVLLEIVSGRRNFDVSPDTNQKKFSVWAYEEFEKGNIEGIMDKRLLREQHVQAQDTVDMGQVLRAVQVSFWCIQEQPSHRPSMGKVVRMLEGIAEIEKPPAPKAAMAEGSSVSGNSINISSNISALSTFAPSAPAPSSSSSIQAAGVSPLASSGRIRNPDSEKVSSSLLGSDSK